VVTDRDAPGRAREAAREDDDGNVLLDAHDDRWEWRRRIRADPHKHRIYRVVVGLVGVLLILLGAATGWLPGPGGIPLVLAGLAVLASEFEWAQGLLHRANVHLQHGRAWLHRQPRWYSWVAGAVVVVALCLSLWLSLSLFGYPGWTPDAVATLLDAVPNVDRAG
jgi:hypothetical protein